MIGRRVRWAGVLVLLAWPSRGCAVPECTQPDYSRAECRVVAENELARLQTSSRVEIRFQDPRAELATSWDARGLLAQRSDAVAARVAGPGQFAISIEPGSTESEEFTLELDNVDAAADVWIEVGTEQVAVPARAGAGLRRTIPVELEAGRTVWIRGRRSCPDRFRVAFVGDIQTNPAQFERIVERLIAEREEASAMGEPLVAIAIPGDLTEFSRDDEFDVMLGIFAHAPVPVVVTPGNHDIYRPGHPQFNRRFGPGNHVSEVCTLRLVMLDTGSGAVARSIEARLPEFFERGDARHVIVAMHHPPFAGFTGAGWSREDAAQRLLAEAARNDVDLLVAGHTHALRDFASIPVGDRRLRQVVVGTGGADQGLGRPRFGYLRVTVGPEELDTCFVEVPSPGLDGPSGHGLPDRIGFCDG